VIQLQKTTIFKKKFKLMLKRGKDPNKMIETVNILFKNVNNKVSPNLVLPENYKLHKLSGNYKSLWDCHIEPDWILLYYLDDKVLRLENTGTHSDIFK
jgi:mRNA interferase YafQ